MTNYGVMPQIYQQHFDPGVGPTAGSTIYNPIPQPDPTSGQPGLYGNMDLSTGNWVKPSALELQIETLQLADGDNIVVKGAKAVAWVAAEVIIGLAK